MACGHDPSGYAASCMNNDFPQFIIDSASVESGTFPSSRAEDVEEERSAYRSMPSRRLFIYMHNYLLRRLLYVACTRAQGLLYLSHSRSRKIAGESKNVHLSEFVSAIASYNLVRDFVCFPPINQIKPFIMCLVCRWQFSA